MSWDAGFAVDLPNNPVDTDPTGNREQTGRTAGGTDKLLAHVFEQITRVNEEIARAEEKFSKPEHNAPRDPSDPPQPPMNTFRPAAPGSRPSLGARAVRGLPWPNVLGSVHRHRCHRLAVAIVQVVPPNEDYRRPGRPSLSRLSPPTIEKAGFTIQPRPPHPFRWPRQRQHLHIQHLWLRPRRWSHPPPRSS